MNIKSFVVGLGVSAMVFASGSAFAANLLFSVDHNDLPESGDINAWGGLTAFGGKYVGWTQQTGEIRTKPQVEIIDGVKWEKNVNDNAAVEWFGFQSAVQTAPISALGATIITHIRPTTTSVEGWDPRALVNVFHDQLSLGVERDGTLVTMVKGELKFSRTQPAKYKMANGIASTISMTVLTNGSFTVWADGVAVMSGAARGDDSFFTQLTPHATDANKQRLCLGRRPTDNWSAFIGNIGDTYLYAGALSDSERIAMENSIAANYAPVPEPTSIVLGAMGLSAIAGLSRRRKK